MICDREGLAIVTEMEDGALEAAGLERSDYEGYQDSEIEHPQNSKWTRDGTLPLVSTSLY